MADLDETVAAGDPGHPATHAELARRHNSPSARAAVVPAATFDTTTTNTWEDVGMEVTRTPSEDETITVLARLRARTSDGSDIDLRVLVDPAPAGGPAAMRATHEDPGTSKFKPVSIVDAVDLASGTAYTIKVQAQHVGAGTTRVEAAESRLTLVIVPR